MPAINTFVDKFRINQLIEIPLEVIAKKKNINITVDSNKFDTDRFFKLKEQLRANQQLAIENNDGVEEANEALAIFDQLKKFLTDRAMLKVDKPGVWEPVPCLLDEDGNEVHFKEDTVIIRDKWSR